MDTLTDTNAVINVLGGTQATADLTGRHKAQVSFWRKANRFPAKLHVRMRTALAEAGYDAPDDLWGIDQQEAPHDP